MISLGFCNGTALYDRWLRLGTLKATSVFGTDTMEMVNHMRTLSRRSQLYILWTLCLTNRRNASLERKTLG
jgi:hypothetical protein